MCKVSNQSGPSSGGGVKGQKNATKAAPEREHGARREKTDYKLVRLANKKLRLITVLHRYGIAPIRQQFSKWSNPIRCPFHKGGRERTASFGYNFDGDWFNCLSCNRHGRAVEFIAYFESSVTGRLVTFNEVANIILSRYEHAQELDLGEDDSKKVEELLFGFSKFLQELNQKNKYQPEKKAWVEKVTWCFDCYLDYAVPSSRISLEDLEARIEQAKGLLNEDEQ